MNILMLGSEVSPFAKVGGLGDVLGSLPQKLAEFGHDVRVMMPKYGLIDEKYTAEMEFEFYEYCHITVLSLVYSVAIWGINQGSLDGAKFMLLSSHFDCI